MLKGIPAILSPQLLETIMEMGHGDELVLADGNFPSESMGQRVIRADGHGVPDLLDAIMKFFPLDQYVDQPAALMQKVPGDTVETPIWGTYLEIVKRYEKTVENFEFVERFAFYERTKQAYAVVATGEKALYANIILKKGVVA